MMIDSNVKEYIVSLLSKDKRVDGRKLEEFRKPIIVETGVSIHAEGSARVLIGNTEVMAGVKMAVGTPFPDTPDQGVLITGAELLPLSNPDFESGPPGGPATELARVVDRGIRESKMIDTKKLCIKEGELVWMIYLDIYTVNDDGNLLDASALAAVAALRNAVLPKLENNKVVYGEFTKEKLPLKRMPITCTLYKIGQRFVVDVNTKEEKAVDARLTVAVSEDDIINALQKGGSKGLTLEEIDTMIDVAIKKTKELRKVLEK